MTPLYFPSIVERSIGFIIMGIYSITGTSENPRQLLEACSDLFVALADTIRRGLFIRMIESGRTGVSVSTLTATTSLSRPAISHHLKVLRNCGLIKARKDGTHNFYYVDLDEHINRLKQFLRSAERYNNKN